MKHAVWYSIIYPYSLNSVIANKIKEYCFHFNIRRTNESKFTNILDYTFHDQ